ncbi:MAG: hypothetical protein QOF18_1724 [Frankiaceae bacterium]|jgi:hypothetical protein|nr:hypothetical protein [Frankiaceae bacterium]
MRQTVVGMTRTVVATLWRDGGQRTARRNAWAAMVSDNVRARARAEAAAAVALADTQQSAGQPVAALRG